MIEHFKILTITHKQLNAEDLEHFVVKYSHEAELCEKLKGVKDHFQQEELLYLATCNRVIFFFYGEENFNVRHSIDLLHYINPELSKSKHQQIDKLLEFHVGTDAIRHIYEVASSIDSLVIGEREIFRQFREAYTRCRQLGLCGDNMRLIEKCTVKAAKDVYTNTEIGAKPVSVVSLAIQEFLKRKLPKTARVLLVGSGETNTTVGRFLKKHGYNNIIIFNRTFDNALQLSEELDAKAMHLAELYTYADGFDALFSCTSATEPIITSKIYDYINRDQAEKLVIDLSIPQNVAKDVANMDAVDYINVDSLRQRAEDNLRYRSGNIAAARIILNGHLVEFTELYERRKVERVFGALPLEIRKIKDRALTQVYKEAIETLPQDAQSLILEIATYMEKKCVAVPMRMAKEKMA